MHAVNDGRIELEFAANMSGFRDAFGALVGALHARSLQPSARYSVELVFEEVVANIVRHGALDGSPERPAVRVAVDVADDAIVMTFDDDGPPFDPCGREDPVPATSLADAEVGGLGLMLVRRAAKDMVYRRLPEDTNRLVVTLATRN